MTDDAFQEEMRDAAEAFRRTVVEALKNALRRAEDERDKSAARLGKVQDTLAELSKSYNEKAERLDETRGALRRSEQLLNDTAKELSVVKRDRDALVLRAETAENTLVNHGVDLHTMERRGSAAHREKLARLPHAPPEPRPKKQPPGDQYPGRYQTFDGRPLGEGRAPGASRHIEDGDHLP